MTTAIKIKVGVFNTVEGPKVFIDPTMDLKSAGKANKTPVDIEWELTDSDGWNLVGIDFKNDAGKQEFEANPGIMASGKKIKLRDKMETIGDFHYTIWCAPANGLGCPISLDPTIRNEPPL